MANCVDRPPKKGLCDVPPNRIVLIEILSEEISKNLSKRIDDGAGRTGTRHVSPAIIADDEACVAVVVSIRSK